ncbi:MAG: DUF7108 family protein [Halobacteriota archaeon]|uniref:DUF7108 family protein n=1 Tax=Natronomonas sp. TaxID=2184060 RepID=UPI0039768232
MVDETPTPDSALIDDHDGEGSLPLPEEVIARAETLTRRVRSATDENERTAYRDEREELLDAHGYTARVREGDTGETLVLYPVEWVEDGTVRLDRITDTTRAVERSISGPGADADWDAIDEHNRAIAARIEERHGEVHGATAAAFADFMSNHYAKPIEAATAGEREEFRTEYFPRNAWPSEEQRRRIDESLRRIVEVASDGSDG